MKKLIGILSLLYCCNSYAINGNELHEMLQGDSIFDKARGQQFVIGVIDTEALFYFLGKGLDKPQNKQSQSLSYICLPEGANYGQAIDIVKKYLNENPQNRELHAAYLVHASMIKIWACTQ